MKTQITLFTTCKPFEGVTGVHQENALRSWAELGVSIIVFGDESGVANICSNIGATHIQDVARNPDGLPMVSSLFGQAEQQSTTPYLAYLNADIILLPNFLGALQILRDRSNTGPIFATARRQNILLNDRLDFQKGTQQCLIHLLETQATWDHPFAIDLFLFSKGLFANIPDFSIGRPLWDNWMVWQASQQAHQVIDISPICSLIHPIHGYQGNWQDIIYGDSAARNRALGDFKNANIETNCTHTIEKKSIVPLTSERKAKYQHQYKPNIEKELTAALEYLITTATANPDRTLDDLKSLFWRWQSFFPLKSELQAKTDGLFTSLSKAQAFCRAGSHDKALDLLQDFLCTGFIRILEKNSASSTPLYIWGAGQYGRRIYDFLQRHGIKATGFLDSNPAVQTSDNLATPIWPPKKGLDSTAAGNIIIGTMYYKEVLAQLGHMGGNPEKCLF